MKSTSKNKSIISGLEPNISSSVEFKPSLSMSSIELALVFGQDCSVMVILSWCFAEIEINSIERTIEMRVYHLRLNFF